MDSSEQSNSLVTSGDGESMQVDPNVSYYGKLAVMHVISGIGNNSSNPGEAYGKSDPMMLQDNMHNEDGTIIVDTKRKRVKVISVNSQLGLVACNPLPELDTKRKRVEPDSW